LYFTGSSFYFISVSFFLLFFLFNYYGAINKKYISNEKRNGCSKIAKEISGVYLLDSNLQWNLDLDYLTSRAVFILSLNTFYNSASDITLLGIENAVVEASESFQNMSSYNLAYTTLKSVTYFRYLGVFSNHFIQTTGDATSLYTLSDYSLVQASSASGVCNIEGYLNFDQTSSEIKNVWTNLTEITNSKEIECSTFLNPLAKVNNNNNNTIRDEPVHNRILYNQLTYILDVHTFTIAMSINLDYNSADDLSYVVNLKETQFYFHGKQYIIKEHSDDRYDMKNIFCLMANSSDSSSSSSSSSSSHNEVKKFVTKLCFINILHVLALPIFNHIGNSFIQPEYCDCTSKVGYSERCNMFNLMTGIVFYKRLHDNETIVDDVIRLMTLANRYESYEEFNNASYLAQFYSYDQQTTMHHSNALHESFDFCRINSSSYSNNMNETATTTDDDDETLSCSMINIYNMQDPLYPNYFVNRFTGYKEFNGSCSDFYKFKSKLVANR
jgi:hypothetical protein